MTQALSTVDLTVAALQESARHNEKNIDKLDRDLKDFRSETLNQFTKVSDGINQLETKVDQRFDKVDQRFTQIEDKFDQRIIQVETKSDQQFDKIDQRFTQIEAKFDGYRVKAKFQGMKNKV